jgi:hypothetical protein
MANKEGYPWSCERDGMNVKDIAERPVIGLVKTHTERHDSETGRELDHSLGSRST